MSFRSYPFAGVPFAQTPRRSTEEVRPETVVELWARSVQCVACGVRSELFFRREWIKRYPGFSFWGVILYLPGILHFSKCCFFAHHNTYLFENSTVCHNSGCPVQGQVWGAFDSPSLGALGASCRVSRVHVPCVMGCFFCSHFFFFFNRPPAQIAWVQLWVWGREFEPGQASVPFVFFRSLFTFRFSHFLFFCF